MVNNSYSPFCHEWFSAFGKVFHLAKGKTFRPSCSATERGPTRLCSFYCFGDLTTYVQKLFVSKSGEKSAATV
jgi:hypothetical protein